MKNSSDVRIDQGATERRLEDIRTRTLPRDPRRHGQAFARQELAAVELRRVAVGPVAQNGDDGVAGSEVSRNLHGTGDVDAGRAANLKRFQPCFLS